MDDSPRPSGLQTLVPSVPSVLAAGLRRPETLAIRRPWKGLNPYSSEFAVSTLPPLLRQLDGGIETIYFVGHSAGCPISLRCYVEAMKDPLKFLPEGSTVGGCLMASPALLELNEDPDAYDQSEDDGSRIPLPLRLAAFRTLLSLPDAFSIKLARRLVERDVREALLAQTHPRMAEADMTGRVQELAEKYLSPTREFADNWDTALLNVYRADVGNKEVLKGRKLLSEAKTVKRSRIGVLTGDTDGVVPVRASRRVAELLGVPLQVIERCGHIPMDEVPEEFASRVLDFIANARA
ncbi:hypothetical protein TrRE_jg6258 [Triparma retinervis]|uniref:AB hydrolase-1 domain-containing protein n=1 Tax=Triparma retinervis TaxID=2557542 RepID=A0A9W7CD51_9STRA|nr:hypothetical protein TrRE_jg6258 [Triparma retinervis]